MDEMTLGAHEWLALSLVPKLGCHRVHSLWQRQLDWPQEWYSHLSQEQAHYLRYLLTSEAGKSQLAPLLSWCNENRQRYLLYPSHPQWPSILNEIHDPPIVLWAWGNLSALTRLGIAIVGSRKASMQGCERAHAYASQLATEELCIISGLALGIDAAAHHGALSVEGQTIAVLGCGIDVLYPARNGGLREQLLDRDGLLLSEFCPGTPAHPRFFPRRNRIITGLSIAILVAEATMRSGSLVSARLALEQNRDVFAFSGDPENAGMAGCHWLIQQGAMLVTTPQEILDAIPITDKLSAVCPQGQCHSSITTHVAHGTDVSFSSRNLPPQQMSECLSPIHAALCHEPISLDELMRLTKESYHACMTELQLLEINGAIKRVLGGWVRA